MVTCCVCVASPRHQLHLSLAPDIAFFRCTPPSGLPSTGFQFYMQKHLANLHMLSVPFCWHAKKHARAFAS